jgi:hypothetical protein
MYYPTTNAKYESLSGTTTLGITPSKKERAIISLTNAYTFKIPLNPVVATHASTH